MLRRTLSRNVFQPAFFQELDDQVAKSCPNLTRFCRHDHKGLVNVSTEGIDESLHGLGEIEEFPSKNGVFSRIQKLRSEGARESEGFSTRLEVLGSLQGVTKTTRTNSTTRAQESKTKIEFQSNNARKRKELRQDQNPGGHKEDRASFPNQIHSKVSTIHP